MAEEKKTKAAPKKAADKTEPETEVKDEAQAEGKAETKSETKSEGKAAETAQKAIDATSEAAKVAYDATRDAAMSAFKGATVVVTDPMGGQAAAMAALGEKGCLTAGIFFTALYVVLGYLFTMFGSFGTHLKIIGMWVVAPAALFGCFYALSQFYKQKITLAQALFSTGVTLFPMTVAIVLTCIGVFTYWISGIILIYCFSILILLIGGYLLNVLKASTQQAVLLAPAVLVVVFVVLYIYGSIVFNDKELFRMFFGSVMGGPGMPGSMPPGMF